jgi:hypothetical integral membrane protein (TIGR02206 family)
VIGGNELFRYFHDGIQFPGDMPLHLCTMATWMAVVACLTLRPIAVEFAYLVGCAGATLALINPDMPPAVLNHPASYEAFRYFLEHGGIVITGSALVFGKMVALRPGAVVRAWGMFAAYAAFLTLFNRLFGTNYLYLAHKPVNPSLLDYLGPWPVYIFSVGIISAGLFWLLWLAAAYPNRTRRVIQESYYEDQDSASVAVFRGDSCGPKPAGAWRSDR